MKFTPLLIGVVSITLASCGSGTHGTEIAETGTSTSTSKKGLSFKLGEEVKLGDYVIKVNKWYANFLDINLF